MRHCLQSSLFHLFRAFFGYEAHERGFDFDYILRFIYTLCEYIEKQTDFIARNYLFS